MKTPIKIINKKNVIYFSKTCVYNSSLYLEWMKKIIKVLINLSKRFNWNKYKLNTLRFKNSN